MKTNESCFQFPCEFPLKVMGLNNEIFTTTVMAIFQNHLTSEDFFYETKVSSSNKYASITVTFTATSSDQLNAIYEELNANELILMTL